MCESNQDGYMMHSGLKGRNKTVVEISSTYRGQKTRHKNLHLYIRNISYSWGFEIISNCSIVMSLFVSDMPTNFACPRQPTFPRPTKRPLSFDMEQYLHEPVHKVYISEKFANDLAAMSLNHREERRPPEPFTVATTTKDIPEYQAYVIDEEGLSQPGKDPKSVVVVDDINDFLSSDDEQPDDNSMDTDYTLPMQKRPGDSKYRIPDFVLQSDQG